MNNKTLKRMADKYLSKSINSACALIMYQSVLPKNAKEKFKK